MRGKRRIHSKMAEVADRAGVSLSTVSRALAGSALISEATKRAVRAAAQQLDYRIGAAAAA
jgi:LacI family transcriptional regulator, repressor for deo operon, udp, cdd, tsx, nupC, and nupG